MSHVNSRRVLKVNDGVKAWRWTRLFLLPFVLLPLVPAVLAHRLIMNPEARMRNGTPQAVVAHILSELPIASAAPPPVFPCAASADTPLPGLVEIARREQLPATATSPRRRLPRQRRHLHASRRQRPRMATNQRPAAK